MRTFVIGCAVCGVAGIASFSGSEISAQQVIAKDPATVFGEFGSAIGSGQASGVPDYGSQGRFSYAVEVKKQWPERIDVTVTLNQQWAGALHYTFTPQKGGSETLVAGKVEVDRKVVSAALAGTPNTNLGMIPTAAYQAGMKKMLAQAKVKIEAGQPLEGRNTLIEMIGQGHERKRAGSSADGDFLEPEQNVARPMVDPNEAARNYLNQDDGYGAY